jgi:chromosome partitioning protein
MARTIAVAVPKGGTGKTTTTMNLGGALAERGHRVLLVDFDPSGSLSRTLGQGTVVEPSVYTAITHYLETYEPQLDRTIVRAATGTDLIPTDVRLNNADTVLRTALNGQLVLKQLLEPLTPMYDYILIDTLPYLGILVTNTLVAADEVIIPMESEYLATQSVPVMLQHITQVRKSGLNPNLAVTGILITKASRTTISRQIIDYTRAEFEDQVTVFETVIPDTVRFTESQAMGQSILTYESQGKGAQAYRALAEEVLRATA